MKEVQNEIDRLEKIAADSSTLFCSSLSKAKKIEKRKNKIKIEEAHKEKDELTARKLLLEAKAEAETEDSPFEAFMEYYEKPEDPEAIKLAFQPQEEKDARYKKLDSAVGIKLKEDMVMYEGELSDVVKFSVGKFYR